MLASEGLLLDDDAEAEEEGEKEGGDRWGGDKEEGVREGGDREEESIPRSMELEQNVGDISRSIN